MVFMVLFLLSIAIGVPTVASIKKETESISRELVEKNKTISTHLAFSVENAFWTLNWVFVDIQLKKVVHATDVVFVGMYKSDGQLYLTAGKSPFGRTIQASEFLSPEKQTVRDFTASGQDEMMKLVITPVKAGNDIWTLIMGISLKQVDEARAVVIREGIILGILVFVLGVFASFFFARGLANRIQKLSEGTDEIARGNLDFRIDLRSHDEIRDLADSFNKMAEDLKRTTTSRDSLVKEIAERKAAEAERRASEERFRILTEKGPFGMAIIDAEGAYEYVNPKFVSIFGYNLADIPTGGKWFEIAFPDKSYQRAAMSDWIGDREKIGVGQPIRREYKVRCKDGTRKAISFSAVKLPNGKTLIAYEDRTETRVLEDQLRQATKMEAVGTLAGGIAHDFNNILQAITGYNQLLQIEKNVEDKDLKFHEQIDKSIAKASELTRQLLTFSRKVESKLQPVDLTHEIRTLEKLLRRTISKMIEIRLYLTDELQTVNADPGQMEQVMVNIALNARDAMPEGGVLTFATENRTIDEAFVRAHHGAREGEYVKLSISDTGQGMDEATVEHIFEPFYTTKGPGRGTGLGLAMVYGIVKSHHGYIDCTSKLGRGTSFDIYLPVLNHDNGVAIREKPKKTVPERGNERILLVDDEKTIRELGKEMLGKYGYRVVTASSGEDALGAYDKEKIDLVLLDLDMPGMGGNRCLREIIDRNPDAKIIIASGYSAGGGARECLEAGAMAFLGKPYQLHEMLGKIREVLSWEVEDTPVEGIPTLEGVASA